MISSSTNQPKPRKKKGNVKKCELPVSNHITASFPESVIVNPFSSEI